VITSRLADDRLSYLELDRSLANGARFVTTGSDHGRRDGPDRVPLFFVSPSGALHVLTPAARQAPRPGDSLVALDRTSTAAFIGAEP
jgi:hypothetical protein